MIDYMDAMVDDFTTKFKPDDTAQAPAAEGLFAEGTTYDLDKATSSQIPFFFC